MRLKYKIFIFLIFALTGFLFISPAFSADDCGTFPGTEGYSCVDAPRRIGEDVGCQTGHCPGGREMQCCPPELCGNNRINGGEECDDGNNTSGDGCSNICRLETPAAPPTPTGSCFCCWADAPEPGELTQDECTAVCTDKGSVKTFRPSSGTDPGLSRDCIPRPEEETGAGSEGEGEGEGEESEEPASGGSVLAGGLQKAAGQAGFQSTPIEDIISNIIYIALGFVGVIFLGLTLFAGFIWMMARGNEQEIEKAKKMLEAAVLGMIIVFAAYAITYFVTSRLLGKTEAPSSACPAGEVDCTTICTGGTYPDALCAPDAGSCVCSP